MAAHFSSAAPHWHSSVGLNYRETNQEEMVSLGIMAMFVLASYSFCYSNQLKKREAPPNEPASSSDKKLQKPPVTLQANKLAARSFLNFST